MAAMRAALHAPRRRLGEVDAGLLTAVLGSGVGLFDMVQLMGMRSGVVDWFRFRAQLLNSKIKGFGDAGRAAAGHDGVI